MVSSLGEPIPPNSLTSKRTSVLLSNQRFGPSTITIRYELTVDSEMLSTRSGGSEKRPTVTRPDPLVPLNVTFTPEVNGTAPSVSTLWESLATRSDGQSLACPPSLNVQPNSS